MSLRRPHLTLIKSSRKPSRSLAKGVVAGLVGGLVATAARSLALKAYPPHSHSDRSELPPVEPTSRALTLRTKVVTSPLLPWAVGAAAGAAYGGVAEFYPAATSKEGVAFGMTLASLAQDGPLSAVGFAPNPVTQTTRERSSEMTSFVVFGIVTETVRRVVRRLL
jgi:putative membrane protein